MKNNYKTQLKNHKFSTEDDELSLHQFGKTTSELVEEIEKTEMKKVTTKPLSKVWFEVSNKIKFSNPKKIEPLFNFIISELKEIYGEEIGNVMGNLLLDDIEGEFYKLNNGDFFPFVKIIRKCSQNKWQKVIDRVNSNMTLERELLVG